MALLAPSKHTGPLRWLPNFVSIARLALVPWIAALVLGDRRTLAFWLFVFTSATDGLDGWLARRLSAQSRLGAMLDPIADKLLLVTVLICLWMRGLAPAWFVGLVFARDLLILAFAGYAFAFTTLRDFPPSIWGKVSTVVQAVVAGALLTDFLDQVDPALVGICTVTTAWSGVHYAVTGVRRLRAA